MIMDTQSSRPLCFLMGTGLPHHNYSGFSTQWMLWMSCWNLQPPPPSVTGGGSNNGFPLTQIRNRN